MKASGFARTFTRTSARAHLCSIRSSNVQTYTVLLLLLDECLLASSRSISNSFQFFFVIARSVPANGQNARLRSSCLFFPFPLRTLFIARRGPFDEIERGKRDENKGKAPVDRR